MLKLLKSYFSNPKKSYVNALMVLKLKFLTTPHCTIAPKFKKKKNFISFSLLCPLIFYFLSFSLFLFSISVSPFFSLSLSLSLSLSSSRPPLLPFFFLFNISMSLPFFLSFLFFFFFSLSLLSCLTPLTQNQDG